MKKSVVTLLVYGVKQDKEGYIKQELQAEGNHKGIIIPITTEMAQKQYGYAEAVSHQMFVKGKTPDTLCAGNSIEYKGEVYTICHVSDYIKVKVVLMREVVR